MKLMGQNIAPCLIVLDPGFHPVPMSWLQTLKSGFRKTKPSCEGCALVELNQLKRHGWRMTSRLEFHIERGLLLSSLIEDFEDIIGKVNVPHKKSLLQEKLYGRFVIDADSDRLALERCD